MADSREFKIACSKMLIDLALKKIEQYELAGNKAKAEHLFALAHKIEKNLQKLQAVADLKKENL